MLYAVCSMVCSILFHICFMLHLFIAPSICIDHFKFCSTSICLISFVVDPCIVGLVGHCPICWSRRSLRLVAAPVSICLLVLFNAFEKFGCCPFRWSFPHSPLFCCLMLYAPCQFFVLLLLFVPLCFMLHVTYLFVVRWLECASDDDANEISQGNIRPVNTDKV